jgi:hypothetical protein
MRQIAEKTSVNKIRVFHAMLAKANLMTQKETILSSYDVQSTKQLTDRQLDELINWLSGEINRRTISDRDWLLFDARNSQHLYILSLCHQIGWVKYDDYRRKHIADMASLATWLKSKSRHKLPILKQTREQLQDTIYQLEKVLESI